MGVIRCSKGEQASRVVSAVAAVYTLQGAAKWCASSIMTAGEEALTNERGLRQNRPVAAPCVYV